MWESENELCRFGNGTPASCIKADGFHFRDHSWHVDTDVPSDFLVQIGDVSFHLHKYPLLSKCGKMNRIVYDDNRHDAPEHKKRAVVLDDLPGGAESFELAAKFCYGVEVDHTAANISGLRCAAEYLEMTEDLEEGNLIFKTEAFLSYVVLSSWRDSIIVLKSCERLSPWAENLQIVRRCSESIAWKACTNPKGIRWPLTGKPPRVLSPQWTDSIKDSSSSSPGKSQVQVPPDWWFDDVSILRIDHFVRVVTAIKVKGMSFELIGEAIMHYAIKWLPGLIREGVLEDNNINNGGGSCSSSGGASWKGGFHMMVAGTKEEVLNVFQAKDQRMIVESLISIIPQQRDIVPCGFLLRLLGMANMLKVAPALVTELEKRAGMQFEQATLADLLVPSYNMSETLYDIDLVQRLLEHFLVQEQPQSVAPPHFEKRQGGSSSPPSVAAGTGNAKTRVARLVDSYLTEVSRDKNLSLTKFQILAEALPESARSCDDGLYRAVDSYIKAHPTLSEHERKRLCRVMDCQKLSIDACMHAAQNERLPLRVVVQVLFSEQVKISNAIANKEEGESDQFYQAMVPSRREISKPFQEGLIAAKKDINTLKFELESVKAQNATLQNDMEILQRQFDKMSRQKAAASSWSGGWKKLTKLTKTTQQTGNSVPQSGAEKTRKTSNRRWRNSIS